MWVSIIINNYNYGRFLKDAIDSALGQTYGQLEVIVVDDGSTDHSREIIARYGSRVIPILQPNGGQASAMNAGLARSTGHIVLFLDSDDVLLPHAVKEVVGAFRKQPDAARVHFRMQVIDASGEPTGVLKPHAHFPLVSGDLRQHVLYFPDDMPWLPTSGNAYSARVLRKIFPIPVQEYRILADLYLSHITPLFGPVIGLSEVGAQYRVHGNNNYEVTSLNLEQLRRTVQHWRTTHRYVRKFALAHRMISHPCQAPTNAMACLANQLISLKLEPHKHLIPGDSVPKLFWSSVTAVGQRFNASWQMKLFYILWFLAMSLAPRSLAHWLAVKWHFPETRKGLSSILARFQWRQRTAHAVASQQTQPTGGSRLPVRPA